MTVTYYFRHAPLQRRPFLLLRPLLLQLQQTIQSSKHCFHPMNFSIPSFSAAAFGLMVAATRLPAFVCVDGLTRRGRRAGYLLSRYSTACSQVKLSLYKGMRAPEAAGRRRARTWASATSNPRVSVAFHRRRRLAAKEEMAAETEWMEAEESRATYHEHHRTASAHPPGPVSARPRRAGRPAPCSCSAPSGSLRIPAARGRKPWADSARRAPARAPLRTPTQRPLRAPSTRRRPSRAARHGRLPARMWSGSSLCRVGHI